MRKKALFVILAAFLSVWGSYAQPSPVKVKYQGEVDFGYSIGVGTFAMGRANLHTIQGLKIGSYFSTGIGIGLDYYLVNANELMMPVYLNLKGYIPVTEKFSPYFSLDLGVGIGVTSGLQGSSGEVLTPAIGIRAGKFKAQLGYNMQRISESGIGIDMNSVQLKIGFMF